MPRFTRDATTAPASSSTPPIERDSGAARSRWAPNGTVVRSGGSRVIPGGRAADRLITQVTRTTIAGSDGVDVEVDTETEAGILDDGLGADIVSAMTADGECDVPGHAPRDIAERREAAAAKDAHEGGPAAIEKAAGGAKAHADAAGVVSGSAGGRGSSGSGAVASEPIVPLGAYMPVIGRRAVRKKPAPAGRDAATARQGRKLLAIGIVAALATLVLALLAMPPAASTGPDGQDNRQNADKPRP